MSDERSPFDEQSPFSAIGIGASAGGLRSILKIVEQLPADLPAAVVVALHRSPESGDLLVQLLRFRSRLPVKHAEQSEDLSPGMVYVAPPGRHVELTAQGTISVSRIERINFVRPSIDLLFQSLAVNCGSRSLGVLLSGTGGDGSQGIGAIRNQGGFTIAQDETTAPFFEMPNTAIETAKVDLVLPAHRIPFALVTLLAGTERAIAETDDPGPIGRQYRLHSRAYSSSAR
jgi:two-component system chemotaxis response regulator CheB